jgi:para-nitrobenzyl esterase
MSDQGATDFRKSDSELTSCLLLAPVAALLLISIAGCAKTALGPPSVEAGGETLVGERLVGNARTAVFRGIPYAAPPVDELRWRPPESHLPRAGNQDASRFGPACPQLDGNAEFYRNVAGSFGWPRDEIPDLTDIREDCLYLNVWSQNLGSDEPQPVMVWIHGGGNKNGYAHEPNYLGHNLAKHGVVIVSINYRLGALGFMAHPALTAESDRKVSGNYGLLDQIAALEWVRDNVEAFGGDPDQVTVFGESAGGANIGTLIASPLAKGLFRRAIIQSGGYSFYNTATVSDEAVFGVELMSALGVRDSPGQLEEMRALSWQEIVAAAKRLAPSTFPRAVVDRWLLPKPPADIFGAQEQNPAEIVIGSNANEWLMYLEQPVGEKQLHAALNQSIREGHRAEMLAALNKAVSGDAAAKLDLLAGGAYFHCPSLAIAEAQREVTDRVFVYRFSRVRPEGEKILAYHGAEIPYMFDTADYWLPADRVDWALTDAMVAYWTQFAKTGDPNGARRPGGAKLPNWPNFDPQRDTHQDLGDEVRATTGLQREFCETLDRGRL